ESREGARLSEEEFLEACGNQQGDPLLKDTAKRLRVSKSRVLTSLDFDGCNLWLQDVEQYVQLALVSERGRSAALRLLYLHLSLFLVGFDFSVRTLSFEDL